MSDDLYKLILQCLIAIAGAVAAYFASRNGGKTGAASAVELVSNKADTVIAQNKTVITQNDKQQDKLDEVHRQWNSRLDEWKREQATLTATAVATALEAGKRIGEDKARADAEQKAKDVLKAVDEKEEKKP